MKNKKFLMLPLVLMATSVVSSEYLVTLSDNHYNNSIVIKDYQVEEEEIVVVSPTSGVEVEGWNQVMQYGQEPTMSDIEWQEAVVEMKTGIKVVSGSSYAFISKYKLENANCFTINQVLSLRSNNGYAHVATLFHQENSGCNGSGGDYSLLRSGQYNVVYNNSNYWDEVSGSINSATSYIYIY